jgi:hypothetical protein
MRKIDTKEKIIYLKTFIQILKEQSINYSKINYFNMYIDEDMFFDYIAQIDNFYINICKINEKNFIRYNTLLKINESNILNFEKSEAKIIEFNNEKYFFEKIKMFDNFVDYFSLNKKDKLINSLKELNLSIKNILLKDEKEELFNFFNRNGYIESIDKMLKIKNDDFVLTYIDFEKAIELKRIKFENEKFIFAGLQSFFPFSTEVSEFTAELFLNKKINFNEFSNLKINSFLDMYLFNFINNKHYYTINNDNLILKFSNYKKELNEKNIK